MLGGQAWNFFRDLGEAVGDAPGPEHADDLYSAQFASVPGLFTSLRLINKAVEGRTLHLRWIADSGELLAGPVDVGLPQGHALEQDAAQLFGDGNVLSAVPPVVLE